MNYEGEHPHLDEAWERYREQEAPVTSFQTFYLENYYLTKSFINNTEENAEINVG